MSCLKYKIVPNDLRSDDPQDQNDFFETALDHDTKLLTPLNAQMQSVSQDFRRRAESLRNLLDNDMFAGDTRLNRMRDLLSELVRSPDQRVSLKHVLSLRDMPNHPQISRNIADNGWFAGELVRCLASFYNRVFPADEGDPQIRIRFTRLESKPLFRIDAKTVNQIIRSNSWASTDEYRKIRMEVDIDKIQREIGRQLLKGKARVYDSLDESELVPVRHIENSLGSHIDRFYSKIQFREFSNPEEDRVRGLFEDNSSSEGMDDQLFEWFQVLKQVIIETCGRDDVDSETKIKSMDSAWRSKTGTIFDFELKFVMEIFERIEESSYDDSTEKTMSDNYKKEYSRGFKGRKGVADCVRDQKTLRFVLKYLKLFVVRYLNTNQLESVERESIGKVLQNKVQLLDLAYLDNNALISPRVSEFYSSLRTVLFSISIRCEYIYEFIKYLTEKQKKN